MSTKIKEEKKEEYDNLRINALDIIDHYVLEHGLDYWKINIDELYSINLYSEKPFREQDLRMMLSCCSEHYTFAIVESQFMKYIVRARFYLKI